MEAKNEFGKSVAFVLVIVTMFVLCCYNYNSVTGAASSKTIGNIYGTGIVVFLVILSIFIIIEHSLKRGRVTKKIAAMR